MVDHGRVGDRRDDGRRARDVLEVEEGPARSEELVELGVERALRASGR
jgi:hypothetical protein